MRTAKRLNINLLTIETKSKFFTAQAEFGLGGKSRCLRYREPRIFALLRSAAE